MARAGQSKMVDAFLKLIEGRGTLDGRFTNIRRINPVGGGGHFSLILLATDQVDGKEVVLKFFRPDRLTPTDAYRWECFEREARVLGDFSGARDIIGLVAGRSEFTEHLQTTIPGITIPLKFSYYALEKADSDMEAIIANEHWPADALLNAFRVMTRAVQRVHHNGVAHRDLKPGNFLFIVSNRSIKLSDFGTARSLRESEIPLLTNYSSPPGDLRYCPPEMVACLHDIDPKIAFSADFFALGSILFELFTGVNLGVQMFGPNLLTAVLAPLAVVSRDQRSSIFHQSVGALTAGYPLPAIDSLSPNIPPCIRDRLDELYKGLSHLDYRQRTTSYPRIFRSIDTCLLILNNETNYLRWLREKQRRRLVRMRRNIGVSI